MVKVLATETKEVEIDANEVFKALNTILGLEVLNKDYIWKEEDNRLVAYEKVNFHGNETVIKTDYILIEEKVTIYKLLEKLKSYMIWNKLNDR